MKVVLHRINNSTKEIESFDINLDLPVEERYKNILIKFNKNIKAGILYTAATSLNAKILSEIAEYVINNPSKYDPEWFDYIKAVSKYAELTLSQAIVYSITYDMACTSIITQDKKGNILLSRNLDFGTYFVISHSVFKANYYKNGKYLFSAIELAGFRGVINGVKNNKYAISLNLRRKLSPLYNILRIYQGYPTPNYFMYKVMLATNSYQEAYEMLKSEKITAPVYYILTGINKDEGVLLTRDYNQLDSEEKLNSKEGKWYIVITNHDKDKKDPDSDYRRIPAEKKLEKIGIDYVNKELIFNEILSQYPNNNLITSYTSIHTAQNNGYFNTTIWLP